MMAKSGNMLQIVTRITRMGVLTNTHFCPASTRILNKNCHLPSGYTLVIKHGSAVVDVPWFSHISPIISVIFPYFTNYFHDFPIFHQLCPWFSHISPIMSMIFPRISPIISMIFPWISHDCPTCSPPLIQPPTTLLLCLQAAIPGDQRRSYIIPWSWSFMFFCATVCYWK